MVTLRIAMRRLIFFFTHTATTEIYTLSLHDALPILVDQIHAGIHRRIFDFGIGGHVRPPLLGVVAAEVVGLAGELLRSEEHTSELQSRVDLVCRLLLEKKKINCYHRIYPIDITLVLA